MRSLFNFIVKPVEGRYDNKKKFDDGSEIIVNTEIQNAEFVSRRGIVINTPIRGKTGIKVGDEVIVHHNVFRRFHDIRGDEVNSRSYFQDDQYFVFIDQIFMYRSPGGNWKPLDGFCFVAPLVNDEEFSNEKEKPLTGVIEHASKEMIKNGITPGTVIGFTPNSEYEFIVNDKKLYRVQTNSICIKYGHKGMEEEYRPSWL